MKKLVLVLCVALITMSVAAQESFSYRKGYRGDVSLGGSVGVTKDVRNDAFSLSTTHGYSFGDGVFVGAGVGVNILTTDQVTIPVYVVGKYTFLDNNITPFVDCRVGAEAVVYNLDKGRAFMVSPAVGVDLGRFSIRAGYLCEAGRYSYYDKSNPGNVTPFKLHSVTVSAAVAF